MTYEAIAKHILSVSVIVIHLFICFNFYFFCTLLLLLSFRSSGRFNQWQFMWPQDKLCILNPTSFKSSTSHCAVLSKSWCTHSSISQRATSLIITCFQRPLQWQIIVSKEHLKNIFIPRIHISIGFSYSEVKTGHLCQGLKSHSLHTWLSTEQKMIPVPLRGMSLCHFLCIWLIRSYAYFMRLKTGIASCLFY